MSLWEAFGPITPRSPWRAGMTCPQGAFNSGYGIKADEKYTPSPRALPVGFHRAPCFENKMADLCPVEELRLRGLTLLLEPRPSATRERSFVACKSAEQGWETLEAQELSSSSSNCSAITLTQPLPYKPRSQGLPPEAVCFHVPGPQISTSYFSRRTREIGPGRAGKLGDEPGTKTQED